MRDQLTDQFNAWVGSLSHVEIVGVVLLVIAACLLWGLALGVVGVATWETVERYQKRRSYAKRPNMPEATADKGPDPDAIPECYRRLYRR
jgi:hypothetical protein